MSVNININMVFIFEMEGPFFMSYDINEPNCNNKRKLDWEFYDRS